MLFCQIINLEKEFHSSATSGKLLYFFISWRVLCCLWGFFPK